MSRRRTAQHIIGYHSVTVTVPAGHTMPSLKDRWIPAAGVCRSRVHVSITIQIQNGYREANHASRLASEDCIGTVKASHNTPVSMSKAIRIHPTEVADTDGNGDETLRQRSRTS